MPRPSVEGARRDALVEAAIAEIGRRGTLDVTVGVIARRAGVSTALAHHYFGSKGHILTAAMRRILRDLRCEHLGRLRSADGPRARLGATLAACFNAGGFRGEVVAAWLSFYVSALHDEEARRLLHLYQRRLRSALIADLRPLAGADAPALAETVAALIDGHYIREATGRTEASATRVLASVEAVLDRLLEGRT